MPVRSDQVQNYGTDENLDAIWIPANASATFLPTERGYPLVLQARGEES